MKLPLPERRPMSTQRTVKFSNVTEWLQGDRLAHGVRESAAIGYINTSRCGCYLLISSS